MTLPTIRSTVGRTLLTVLYSVALLWSDAEGIRAKLVLRTWPSPAMRRWARASSPALVISSGRRQRRLRCLRQ